MNDETTEAGPGPIVPTGDLAWAIANWSEKKPFVGRILWSDDTGALLGIDLDPVLVRELFERLAVIHLAQREALGLGLDLVDAPVVTDLGPRGADPDNSAEPARTPTGDVTWEVVDWSEKRPFTGRILWSDDTGPLLGIDLDPVLVRELFERLAVIHLAQCEALGVSIDPLLDADGEPADTDDTDDAAVGDDEDEYLDEDPEDEEKVDLRPWRQRHRFLFAFISLIGGILAIAVMVGACSVQTLPY